MGYPTGLGQVALRSVPFKVPIGAPQPAARFLALPREVRMPPSVEDVKRHLYGSVEKFEAANQASIEEARQRQQEMVQRTPPPTTTQLPPVGLTPEDMETPTPSAYPTEDLVEVPEGGDAEAIEETAEYGQEEEFSGWRGGFDERPVGVTDSIRRQVPALHVRRERSLREKYMRARRRRRR